MKYEIRPLGTWTDPVTADRRGSHVFKASWSDTLGLLSYETEQLGATLVVIQIDVTDYQVRRDGMLRADAKVGKFPGVRVSLDSRHGPLTYATDAHEQQHSWAMAGWQANIRAIALGLGALRAVDRYGISRRGEQYRGWTAIAQRPAEMTRLQAAEFIRHWTGIDDWPITAQMILADPGHREQAYRLAAKRAHPDVTGDDGDTMARLNQARDSLQRTDEVNR